MNQMSYWICDNCNKPIAQPGDAWVEWLISKGVTGNFSYVKKSLRIVHSECRYKEDEVYREYKAQIASNRFVNFQGPDGLIDLLGCIAENKMPQDEVLEIIKRVHIPRYELARPYFNEAISLGLVDAYGAYGYYSQADLQRILDFFRKR